MFNVPISVFFLSLFLSFFVVCASDPIEFADTTLTSVKHCILVLLPMKEHAHRGTFEKHTHMYMYK